MDDKVVRFPGITKVDESVDSFLEKAKGWGAIKMVAVAETEDGEIIFGGSTSDVERILYLLSYAKHDVLMTMWEA